MKEGGGSRPFPQEDKGREAEVVRSRKGSGGGAISTPGDKGWTGGGRGRGARDSYEACSRWPTEPRGHPCRRVCGRWGIAGKRETRATRRLTAGTKRDGGRPVPTSDRSPGRRDEVERAGPWGDRARGSEERVPAA